MRKLMLTFVVVSLMLAANANAGWVDIQKDFNDYGHVWNTDDGTQTGTQKPWCAPTSTINSFKYLESKYPEVYDNKLTKGNIVDSRNKLVNGWGTRSGMVIGDITSAKSWWETKLYWIEDNAPGTTVYKGMVDADPTGWFKGNLLTNAFPTWEFIWTELDKCEDVEIGIVLSSGKHALTLTSLKYDDKNGNGKWDSGEDRMIDYLDSNNPTQLFERDLWSSDGKLWFNWYNGGANPPENVYIDLAYSESVPEPAALVLFGFGAFSLLRKHRA